MSRQQKRKIKVNASHMKRLGVCFSRIDFLKGYGGLERLAEGEIGSFSNFRFITFIA